MLSSQTWAGAAYTHSVAIPTGGALACTGGNVAAAAVLRKRRAAGRHHEEIICYPDGTSLPVLGTSYAARLPP